MSRTNTILGGLLLLQVIAILLVRSPFGGAAADGGERQFLAGLDEFSPARIEIEGKDHDRLELVRDGETWNLADSDGFPADRVKIETLIEDLKQIRVRRPLVASSRHHGTFLVTEDGAEGRLRLWDTETDRAKIDLILGSSSNYRTTHARLADEDAVYEIRGLAPFDLRPDRRAWMRKTLMQVLPETIVGFSLENDGGRFELQKQQGTWSVSAPGIDDGKIVDDQKVTELVRSATGIRMDDLGGSIDEAGQGLDRPAATLVLHLADSSTPLTVRVGKSPADEDSKSFVSSSDLSQAGIVWTSAVSRLIEARLDQLLSDPPEELPAG